MNAARLFGVVLFLVSIQACTSAPTQAPTDTTREQDKARIANLEATVAKMEAEGATERQQEEARQAELEKLSTLLTEYLDTTKPQTDAPIPETQEKSEENERVAGDGTAREERGGSRTIQTGTRVQTGTPMERSAFGTHDAPAPGYSQQAALTYGKQLVAVAPVGSWSPPVSVPSTPASWLFSGKVYVIKDNLHSPMMAGPDVKDWSMGYNIKELRFQSREDHPVEIFLTFLPRD